MADPKQFGLQEWGIVGFFFLILIAAVGILWRQLVKDRRQHAVAIKEIVAIHDAREAAHAEQITQLVGDHRAEVQVAVDRHIVASDKQVDKYTDMSGKMVEVLNVFSRKLDKRHRTAGGGG